ncbi:ATP-binding protein [Nocardiopsis sp. NPDC049922]|uniref:ATP-binding protein n=1 Tax=Nocardiopsis sp. NPDC049922 TaxID=3155157 RepID=UPI0033F02247
MSKRTEFTPEPRRRLPLRRCSFRFAGRPEGVREARYWLDRRIALADAPEEVADTARLLLSELATNSVQHSPARRGERGGFHVRAFFFHGWLRVEVRDTNGRPPTLRIISPDAMAEGGRGLVLVNALASRWGRFRSILGPGMFFELRWDVPEPLAPVVPLPRRER